METLCQPAAELEVEQPAVGRLEDMGRPAEVDGGSTAAMRGAHGWLEGRVSTKRYLGGAPPVGPGRGLFFLSFSKRA
jgi:hypothetical protein